MPYFKIEDLPDTVRHVLPKKAQEIYRHAFNRTWDAHRDPKTLPKKVSRVELAAKIAWTAVKNEGYVKGSYKWFKRHKKKGKKKSSPKIKKQ